MCGIGGILRYDDQPVRPSRLEAMINQLQHRGPDGHGQVIHSRCGLAHTRLAILDAPCGHQPMELPARGSHNSLTVVFNGEIYNHHNLRSELTDAGHVFSSHYSDTEVLLHGYRQWGDDLPAHLEGMFAFAIWDERAQQLFLARDRMGKKPLWFCRQADELVFGSQPATILAGLAGRAIPAINRDALRLYLRLGYTFEQSMFQELEELPPGSCMTVDARSQTDLNIYWPTNRTDLHNATDDDEQAQRTLAELLGIAVGLRLESDVPLGCFLSGGIDSSLVAALAQQTLDREGQPPLQTFCAKMLDAQYDESPHARLVADHLGTQHHELVIDPRPGQQVIDDLRMLTASFGEPMADSSLLPTYWISRAAREHVTVILSGDGGDELFAGYDRYMAMHLIRRLGSSWASYIPAWMLRSSNPRSFRHRLGRFVDAARHATPAAQYQQMVHLFSQDQMRELGVPDYTSWNIARWPFDPSDPMLAAMTWDATHYLPFDLLRKVDRASMAVGLEVRCPLLDSLVVSYARSLPLKTILHQGKPKGILRTLLSHHLPESITRRPKRGFAVPIGLWFRSSLRDLLADHLFDGSLRAIGLEDKPIRRWFEEHTQSKADHTHRLYALLSLSLWSKWIRQ